MARRVLITGASVAGNTVAFWLGQNGFDVTVVERAPSFRDGGQNIDVRGVGREVLRRMELEQQALDRGTGEVGTAWVDEDGRPAAQFVMDKTEGEGPTAEMEILRGDLARLLYEPASQAARYRFGDHVTRIEQDGDHAVVSFAHAASERFDIVVVGEGVGSSTRKIVFSGENDPRWMDLTIAYFTIPRTADDDRMWRWYNAIGGRSISLRPDRHGTTRAMLSLQRASAGEQDWQADRQKAWLRETFSDAGWQAKRILAGLDQAEDFYFDALRQVRMKKWSSGRVVLVGDAAWCATPLAGIGATLAITGGYVLAEELSRAADHATAFKAFEDEMRPMVEKAQGVPKLAPRLMHPKTRLGIKVLHSALAIASRPRLRGVAAKLFARPPTEPDLAKYAG